MDSEINAHFEGSASEQGLWVGAVAAVRAGLGLREATLRQGCSGG